MNKVVTYCVYLNHDDGFGYILDGMFDSYQEAKKSLDIAKSNGLDGWVIENTDILVCNESDVNDNRGYYELRFDDSVIPNADWPNWVDVFFTYKDAKVAADKIMNHFKINIEIHYITELDPDMENE